MVQRQRKRTSGLPDTSKRDAPQGQAQACWIRSCLTASPSPSTQAHTAEARPRVQHEHAFGCIMMTGRTALLRVRAPVTTSRPEWRSATSRGSYAGVPCLDRGTARPSPVVVGIGFARATPPTADSKSATAMDSVSFEDIFVLLFSAGIFGVR